MSHKIIILPDGTYVEEEHEGEGEGNRTEPQPVAGLEIITAPDAFIIELPSLSLTQFVVKVIQKYFKE